jgi:hypothetical protein
MRHIYYVRFMSEGGTKWGAWLIGDIADVSNIVFDIQKTYKLDFEVMTDAAHQSLLDGFAHTLRATTEGDERFYLYIRLIELTTIGEGPVSIH